jgi:hypothetical protein
LVVNGDILSLDARGVSLKSILERLRKEMGIWYFGHESKLEKEVVVSFKAVSLDLGVKKILNSENYILYYGDRGKLVGIVVLSPGPETMLKKGTEINGKFEGKVDHGKTQGCLGNVFDPLGMSKRETAM